MTTIGWIQILLYCAIVVALVKPLGWYMTRVFNGERTFLSPILRPVEAGIYWIGGVDERREQHWLTYTVAMLLFHVGGFLIIYGVMRLQAVLPFNPAGQGAVAEDLSAGRVRRVAADPRLLQRLAAHPEAVAIAPCQGDRMPGRRRVE